MSDKKPTQTKKKGFSIEFRKGISKAEDIIKKDAEIIKKEIKKDSAIIKQDLKKFERSETLDFLITYGWAIIVIFAGIGLFIWFQFFSVHSDTCEFVKGSGIFCENFDVTNESLNIEIRNLNNKTITINQITIMSCSINPKQSINSNDKKRFGILCDIGSGNLREKLVVNYDLDGFQKHTVAKVTKIIS